MYKIFPLKINNTAQTNEELFGEFDKEFSKMLVETGCEEIVTYLHTGTGNTDIDSLVSKGAIPEYAKYRSGAINDSSVSGNTIQVSAYTSLIAYVACFVKNGTAFTFNIHRNASHYFSLGLVANFNNESDYSNKENIFCKNSSPSNSSFSLKPPCNFDIKFILSDEILNIEGGQTIDNALLVFKDNGNHVIYAHSRSETSRNYMTSKKSKAGHNFLTLSSTLHSTTTSGTVNGVNGEGLRYTSPLIVYVTGLFTEVLPDSIKYLSGSYTHGSLLEIENELYYCFASSPAIILKCGD